MTGYTTAWAFYDVLKPDAGYHGDGSQGIPEHLVPSQHAQASSSPTSRGLYNDDNNAKQHPHYATHAQTFSIRQDASLHARVLNNGRTLELRWLRKTQSELQQEDELEDHQETPSHRLEHPVRFTFAHEIIPGITIAYQDGDGAGSLDILLLTKPSLAYRLAFTGPALFHASQFSKGWSFEQHLAGALSGRTPVLVNGIGTLASTEGFVVATAEGPLVKADWQPEEGRFYEYELREQSFVSSFRSLIPSRFTSSASSRDLARIASPSSSYPSTSNAVASSTSQAVSMVSDTADQMPGYLFSVTRDRKLRAYSTTTNTCVETLQLPESPLTMEIVPSNVTEENSKEGSTKYINVLPPAVRPLIRFIPATNARSPEEAGQPHLLVYIPTNNVQTSFFILYALSVDLDGNLQSITSAAEKPCDFAIEGGSSTSSVLCDFQLLSPSSSSSETTLWTLWRENGQSVLRFSDFSAPTSTELMAQNEREQSLDGVELEGTGDGNWTTVARSASQETIPLDVPSGLFDSTLSELQATDQEDAEGRSIHEAAHQLTMLCKQAAVEAFLKHILHPGRYPTYAISTALVSYIETSTKRKGTVPTRSSPSLAQQALDVVGATLTISSDPQTGTLLVQEYVKQFKLEWLRFLALCEESRREAILPLALATIAGQDAFAVAKGALATSATFDTPLVLDRYLQNQSMVSQQTTEEHFSTISTIADLGPTPVLSVYSIAHQLYYSIYGVPRETPPSAFRQAVIEAATSPLTIAQEDIAAELYETYAEAHIDDDLHQQVARQLRAVSSSANLVAAVTAAFDLLVGPDPGTVSTNAVEDMDEDNTTMATASQLLTALNIDITTHSLVGRFQHALTLFLLALYIQGELQNPDESIMEDSAEPVAEEDLAAILGTAFSTLQTLSVAQWAAQHNIAMTDLDLELLDTSDDPASDLLQRLSSLHMVAVSSHESASYSVLAALASDPYYASVFMDRDETLSTGLAKSSSALMTTLGFLSSPSGMDSDHAALMAVSLRDQRLHSECLGLISMSPEKEENAGLLHLVAVVRTERNEFGAADIAFVKVASAIFTDDASLETLRKLVPAEECSSQSSYFRLVVSLLDAQQADVLVAKFCRLALEAYEEETETLSRPPIDEQPAWLKELHYKEFRSYTAVGLYEEAYTVMMKMPFKTTQQDCLRHLVAVMCESGQAASLVAFSFIGLHGEVEKTLSFKARNANPLAVPNYSKILFAWYTSRSDHRHAASTMYQRAKRMASLTGDSATMVEAITAQCQSYLAAVTSLSLVSEEKQFILLDQAKEASAHAESSLKQTKKRRIMDAPRPDPLVVKLDKIRQEYVLSLARLQLSQDFPELQRTNKYLDPTGAVALFTQTGSFDVALQTALALNVNMANIFEHLALRCVRLSQCGRLDEGDVDDTWILQDPLASTWEGSLATKAWRLLEMYLKRYSSAGNGKNDQGEYYRRTLQVILEEDRRIRLPKWLLDWFMAHHPEHLIWRLTEYDLLEDAYRFSKELIDRANTKLIKQSASLSSSTIYLPYNLFDQLLHVDLDEDEPSSRKRMVEELQGELKALVGELGKRLSSLQRQM